MFIRFDMIYERDRQTDRWTDRHRMTAIVALMHSIARQKWCRFLRHSVDSASRRVQFYQRKYQSNPFNL